MKSLGKQLIKNLSIGFALLLIILTVLLFSGFITDYYSSLFAIIFVNTLIAATLFFFLHIREMSEKERQGSKMIEFVSYMFLLSLVILVVNQFLQRDIITNFQWYIVIISIALGFLSFYAKHDSVERELDAEKAAETKAENERRTEFNDKFPTIARIPVLRNVVRWMYAEGWWYSGGLIGIFLLFISIKINMLLIFNGGYLDEYLHIWSGIEFFKNGSFAQITRVGQYKRGIIISILSGLFISAFGRNAFSIKLLPIFLGISSFLLLFKISKKMISNKRIILILLLLYSFSHLVIFNHFYLRMYSLYEFLLLASIFLYLTFIEAIKNNKKTTKYLVTLIILNAINIMINDLGSGLILLANLIFLLYIHFNYINLISYFKIRNIKKKYLIFVIFLAMIACFTIIPDLIVYIVKLMSEVFRLDNDRSSNFYDYFLNLSFVFTLFSYLSLFLVKNNKVQRIVVLIGIFLLSFHLLFLDSLKLMRVVLYLVPLYLLNSTISLSFFSKNKIIFWIVTSLLFVSLFVSYPSNFLNGPGLTNEVRYMDNNVYSDVGELCKNHLIIVSSRPGIATFYGIYPDYYLNTKYNDTTWLTTNGESNHSYYNDSAGKFFEIYTNIPLITTKEEIEEIYGSNDKICYIQGGLPDTWVNEEVRRFIANQSQLLLDDYHFSEERFRMKVYISD